eukprot:1548972-Pyramimonas_sp.AAC.1
MARTCLQDGPRWTHNGPRWPQQGPGGPKTPLRGLQDDLNETSIIDIPSIVGVFCFRFSPLQASDS